jgi:uncharacterized RmlC-like cupin family protein
MIIHHMSFGVSNPERVAQVLAELSGATAMRAPTPPFPFGSWFVLAGDDRGSFLEILPATAVFDPDAPLGLKQRPANFAPGSGHVLISTVKCGEEIETIAKREGWRSQEVETGLFKIVKVWIDGTVLVELFARGEAQRYVETFGGPGMATLESRLRDLETTLASALAAKLSPQILADALGQSTPGAELFPAEQAQGVVKMHETNLTCQLIRAASAYDGKQGLTYTHGISKESVGARAICMHVLTMPPGARATPHLHESHETAIFVLAGQIEAWYGEHLEQHVVAKAGDLFYIPPGMPHMPANLTDNPASAIVARTDPNEQESVRLLPHLMQV